MAADITQAMNVLAAVHPVVVKVLTTPLPVKFHSPQTVTIQDDWVAYATLGFAAAAVVVGIIAIWLTALDLANQREQMKEFRRRPGLRVMLTVKEENGEVKRCEVNIANNGDRSTMYFRLRVYFPESTNINALNQGLKLPPTVLGPDGQTYFVYEKKYQDERLYGEDETATAFDPRINVPDTPVLWDADDDYGHYPDDNTGYGAYQLNPDTSVQLATVPGTVTPRFFKRWVRRYFPSKGIEQIPGEPPVLGAIRSFFSGKPRQ